MILIAPPKAVLFDLDGTLVDSAPDFDSVVNSLRAEEGLNALPYEKIREQVSNGGIALACLAFEITREHPDLMQYRQRVLDRYEYGIGTHSHLFKGFEQVLPKLDNAAIRWGIVTNKPRLYAELLITKLKLDSAVMICPEDVPQRKPHPAPLLKAAQDLQLKATQCWYVGDHARDIEAAIAAQMPSVAALFGYIEPHVNPKDWHADFYIEQPQDLLTLLSL